LLGNYVDVHGILTELQFMSNAVKDVLIAAAVGLAFFLLILPFATVGVDSHHDGVMLKPAADVAQGAALHRETFTQYGPGTTLVQAGLLRVFGMELRVLRYAAATAYGLTVVFLCLFWRCLLPWNLVLVSVFWMACAAYFFSPYWVMLPWSSGMALCVQSIALVTLGRGCQSVTRQGKSAWMLAAGAAVSLVFWFRQPVGATLAVAAVAVPLSIHLGELRLTNETSGIGKLFWGNRYLWLYVSGGLAVAVMFLVWMWSGESLYPWYIQNIVWPRKFAAGYLSAAYVWHCFGSTVVWAPLLVIIAVFYHLSRLQKRPSKSGGTLLAVAALGWFMCLTGLPSQMILIEFLKFIPISSVAILAWWLVTDRSGAVQAILPLSLVICAMSSWAQFYPVPCIRHLFWGVSPIIGVFVYLIWRTAGVSAQIAAICLLAFAMPVASARLHEATEHLSLVAVPHPEQGPLHGMRPYRDDRVQPVRIHKTLGYEIDHRSFEKLRTLMRESGTPKPVVLFGKDALWCLLDDSSRNPGPWYVAWPEMREFGVFESRRHQIEQQDSWVVVQANCLPAEMSAELTERGYRTIAAGGAFGGELQVWSRQVD
jgi:hypothetical protein